MIAGRTLLTQSGRTIGLDGWRIDVGYPEDREEAERRLTESADAVTDVAETPAGDATETDD